MAIARKLLHHRGMRFPEKLDKLMERERLSNVDVGKALGIENSTVSRWRSGKLRPNYEHVAGLARLLGVSADYLVNDTMDDPPQPIGADEAALLDVMRSHGITPAMVLKLLIPNAGTQRLDPPVPDSKHRRA